MTQEFVTLPREVAQQALEALEEADLLMEHRQNVELRRSALVTLRAALEQSKRKPLTEDQIEVIWRENSYGYSHDKEMNDVGFYDAVRDVERAHNIG